MHFRVDNNNAVSGDASLERLNSGGALRIALTADPELPVPPLHYGGIERIIDMLARGLVHRGHSVTLFAHSESSSAGRLVRWPGKLSRRASDTIRNAATLARYVLPNNFDIVHSFSRIAYLTPLLHLRIPKLMTYQREISLRSVRLGNALSGGSLWFSAVSNQMMRDVEEVGTWRRVFNGVPLSDFKYRSDPGPRAPLAFLGRVEEIKGPHLAIEIAKRAGIPLVIAGNVPSNHQDWFHDNIVPHLDGNRVCYIGPVNDEQKNRLLGQSLALLMPVLWEEPFGIVMAEAMACGTPVLGLARGAVPEVIEHGVTGFISDDIGGLVSAVGRVSEINRAACRDRVERLFSDVAVTESYLAIYRDMLATRTGMKA